MRCGRTRRCSTTWRTRLKLRKIAASEVEHARDGRAGAAVARRIWASAFRTSCRAGSSSAWRSARALVYNPPVILLDEPLSNLDAKLREEARAWLRELIVRMQLSALCVTHDQGEALAMSDRILLLNNGTHRTAGARRSRCTAHPITLFTADFMGSNNRLTGTRNAKCDDGAALLEGDGWKLWGAARASAKAGARRHRDDPPRAHSPGRRPRRQSSRGRSFDVDVPGRQMGAPVRPRRARAPRVWRSVRSRPGGNGWRCRKRSCGCSRLYRNIGKLSFLSFATSIASA